MATDDDEYGWADHESIRILIEGESPRRNHSEQSIVTICMVPDSLRNLNPLDYTPRITSMGPLHKEDQRLRAMEERKVTYMYQLFCRTVESTNKDMKQKYCECEEAVLKLIERARACYAPSFTNYDDFKLAEMMVVDGCFILELLYKFNLEGDPIFDNILLMHDVKYDLLLLENQIPFFILEILFSLTVECILESIPLTDLIFYFFMDMNILYNSELTLENGTVEHCHILGLLQSCYRPGTNREVVPTIRYSATEIARAGITFKPTFKPTIKPTSKPKRNTSKPTLKPTSKPKRNSDSLLKVKFKQSSLVPCCKLFIRETSFKIPVLCIKDSTASFLRNLIAYEQCYPLSRHYVTSFAILMDRLIDTNDDVSLLVRAKVLQNNLGACEDVTNLFNNICNGVVKRDFYYFDEWTKLDKYCNRFWPSKLIFLRRHYNSTWKTLAVICAVLIFAVTLVQTIYTVRNA